MNNKALILIGWILVFSTASFGQSSTSTSGYRACMDFLPEPDRCQDASTQERAKALIQQVCLHSVEANRVWYGRDRYCAPDSILVSPIDGKMSDLEGKWVSERTECSDGSPPLASLETHHQKAKLEFKQGQFSLHYSGGGAPWFSQEIDSLQFNVEGNEITFVGRSKRENLNYKIDQSNGVAVERLILSNGYHIGIGGTCPMNTKVLTSFRRSRSQWVSYGFIENTRDILLRDQARAQEARQISYDQNVLNSIEDTRFNSYFLKKLCSPSKSVSYSLSMKGKSKIGILIVYVMNYLDAVTTRDRYDRSYDRSSYSISQIRDHIRLTSRELKLPTYNIFPSEHNEPSQRGSFFQATFKLAYQLSEIAVRGIDYECED